jgi:hypothetical protein
MTSTPPIHQIRIFWSSFSVIFPFNLTEPPSARPSESIRLSRAIHRQKAVLANPKYLTLVAEIEIETEAHSEHGDQEKKEKKKYKEVVGWAGYLRPEGCKDPHPWIVDDDEFDRGTEEDREAWEGVERKYFNGQSMFPVGREVVRFREGIGPDRGCWVSSVVV